MGVRLSGAGGEIPWCGPFRLRPDLVPLLPSFNVTLVVGGSGVLADPAKIDVEFRRAGLPYFCRSG